MVVGMVVMGHDYHICSTQCYLCSIMVVVWLVVVRVNGGGGCDGGGGGGDDKDMLNVFNNVKRC